MNYELAKTLKDAGFIQEGDGIYILPDPPYSYVECEEESWTLSNRVYIPTLSELIEECSKHNKEFEAGKGMAYGGGFREMGIDSFKDGVVTFYACTDINCDGIVCWGKTPEEAVAKLWLELNKKEDTVMDKMSEAKGGFYKGVTVIDNNKG